MVEHLWGRRGARHAGRRSAVVAALDVSPIAAVLVAVVVGVVFLAGRLWGGAGDVSADVGAAPADATATTSASPSATVRVTSSVVSSTTAVPVASSSTVGATPELTAPDPSAVVVEQGATRAVTLAFGGDVHFEGSLRARLQEDPPTVLAPIAPVLSAADIAVVNLETNVTERGTRESKEFTFRAPESAFEALLGAGVDVVSVANNHGRDFGEVGLLDTLDGADRHGVVVIGGGRNEAEAYAAHRVDVAGRRIALLAATQVLDSYALDLWVAGPDSPGLASGKDTYVQRLVDAVTAERTQSDTVVVFLHWGRETDTCPTGAQQELARMLVDAGADIVVGGHAHRVQGGGRLGDAVVHYGLGNFVFYASGGPGTVSGVLEVTVDVDDSLTYRWIPARLLGGVATPLAGDEAAAQSAAWEELRACTDLTP